MSTRLRVIYCPPHGTASAGAQARHLLEICYTKYSGKFAPPRGSMPEVQRLVLMYKGMPTASCGTLYILREPKYISSGRSRWKQLCRHFGIAPRKAKKLKLPLIRQVNAQNIRRAPTRRAGTRPRQPEQPRTIREILAWQGSSGNLGTAAIEQPTREPELLSPTPQQWTFNYATTPWQPPRTVSTEPIRRRPENLDWDAPPRGTNERD